MLKSTRRIEQFMQNHYTDERLIAVMALAEDGLLSFLSCCCFIGCATADHPYGTLRTVFYRWSSWSKDSNHLAAARRLRGGLGAEIDYHSLAFTDKERQALLIPLIKKEIARRESLRQSVADTELTAA